MGTVQGIYKPSLQGNYRVFVPNPLPPQLDLPRKVMQLLEEAAHVLGQANMCRTLLPNPELLVYSSLQREAIASSTIEGTIATPDELVLFQADQRPERREVREVWNYAAALEWGCEQLKSLPITERLILGLHERLLQEVRGEMAAGRFKDRQNWIGPRPSTPIEEATFIPPPPDEVPRLMGDLERYINLDNEEPRLVQCALAHYQFEAIHPFADGNGRVGRLLIMLHLIQLGLLSDPLIHPSVYFERNRAEYYRWLRDVHDNGAWNEWIGYFAQGIIEQGQEALRLVQRMRELQQRLRDEMSDIRRRTSVGAVLDAFFRLPVRSIREITSVAGLSHVAVSGALDVLQEKGIVREITGKRKGRRYRCEPIHKAIFTSEEGG